MHGQKKVGGLVNEQFVNEKHKMQEIVEEKMRTEPLVLSGRHLC